MKLIINEHKSYGNNRKLQKPPKPFRPSSKEYPTLAIEEFQSSELNGGERSSN